MEGLLASATLYGEFMEKYVYSESAVDNKIHYNHSEKGLFVYDTSSIISVWGWQLTYSLMVPLIMMVEVFTALKTSLIRSKYLNNSHFYKALSLQHWHFRILAMNIIKLCCI